MTNPYYPDDWSGRDWIASGIDDKPQRCCPLDDSCDCAGPDDDFDP